MRKNPSEIPGIPSYGYSPLVETVDPRLIFTRFDNGRIWQQRNGFSITRGVARKRVPIVIRVAAPTSPAAPITSAPTPGPVEGVTVPPVTHHDPALLPQNQVVDCQYRITVIKVIDFPRFYRPKAPGHCEFS